ncbi:MAG TPA: glycosyltransferase family 2 protein [Spirochaetota bacterium]|nr:glycosyltransferase family 2 protein [Spirochaetota bacterium]HPR49783.1 glycosyltransferase family 2 protein [Spirochaetota bacterium]
MTNNQKLPRKKLIVVIPAYNEGITIGPTISALRGIQAEIKKIGFDYKIYIVNDGSSDDTAKIAQDNKADRIIVHKVNRGLGAAVRSGLMAAFKDGASIAIKFDADLQHDPDDIIELIQPIIADEADVVYGKRFGNIQYRMPFIRRAGNLVFTKIMKFLTGWPLEDSQPGIFAVNNDYLSVFYIPGDYNYTQQILLDSYHKGMRFAHVPVKFKKRESGSSFVSLKYPFIVLFQIFLVLISVKPIKIFGGIGFAFLTASTIIFTVEVIQWIMGITIKPVVHVNAVLGFLLFGLQSLFFGFLAELIVRFTKNMNK